MNENSFFNSQLFKDAREQVAAIIDQSQQQHINIFGQPWYKKHFTVSPFPRVASEFSAILEGVHAAPAASTINTHSERPIRSIDGFGSVKLEMMTAAHTYKLEAEDLRAMADMKRLYEGRQDYQSIINYVVDKLLNVRTRAIDGIIGNIDLRVLTALSNKGVFTFTQDNDPNSPFVGQSLSFGFDDSHAATANTAWTAGNKATVNVLEDLMAINEASDVTLTKMLMRKEVLMYMLTTDKLKLYVNGSDYASRPISINDVNTFFAQYGLPAIELVEREVRVDKDGGKTQSKIQPWNKNTILFVPDDNFGTIEHRITDYDDSLASEGVTYSKYEGIELQNWTTGIKEGQNYTEYTSAEFTYAPVISSIRNMYSLDVQLG